MTDGFDREITYLRLSVTDLCNLRCFYCMPEEGVAKLPHSEILSVEEIDGIVRAAAFLGITKVRITGGEPLVRRGILDICRNTASVPGISEVCLTTNGILLEKYAEQLRAAGVDRLNISLDSLNPETYKKITRGGDLSAALDGINAARRAGFEQIKINAVLMGGVNDGEIRALCELSRTLGAGVRFIELMPIGGSADWAGGHFVPGSKVLEAVPELIPLPPDGVARMYRLPDAEGTVGLINPLSSHFCGSCNRVRVTSDGKLKPCLHSADEINIRGLSGEELVSAMRDAIYSKPARHLLNGGKNISSSARGMSAIGG